MKTYLIWGALALVGSLAGVMASGYFDGKTGNVAAS